MHREDIVKQLESYSRLLEDNTMSSLLKEAANEILWLSNQLSHELGKVYEH